MHKIYAQYVSTTQIWAAYVTLVITVAFLAHVLSRRLVKAASEYDTTNKEVLAASKCVHLDSNSPYQN